jgi:hypothetical protein
MNAIRERSLSSPSPLRGEGWGEGASAVRLRTALSLFLWPDVKVVHPTGFVTPSPRPSPLRGEGEEAVR